ncbi:MAG: hypothetical protein VX223_08760, partial [Myxococcota bacterium]|nr:hypothetical protein [Myxococcota bacterium]
ESDGTCNLAGCTLDPANVEEVTEVPAGTTLYFVVEHWQGQTGEFTLDLGCCTPTCGEKTCGDDGCGGTCGTCDAGQTCSPDGACLSNECSPVRALTCGESFTVDTAGPDSTNSTLEHGCAQYEDVYSGPEVAYSFSSDSEVEVTIDAPEVNAVEDDGVDVIAIKDQGDGVCNMQFCESSGISTAVFFSAPSDTHYVVFDGYAGASQSELNVGVTCCYAECDGKVCGDDGCGNSCASCPALEACAADQTACVSGQFAGNGTCDTAEIITALPFVGIGSTAGATADYSTLNDSGDAALPGCAGIQSGGKDVVYSYTAVMNGTIEVWLEQVLDNVSVCADPLNDTGCTPKTVNIVTSCPDAADFAGCIAGVDYLVDGTPFPTRAQVDVIANTTYLIVVSGYNANEEGPYKLLVDMLEGSGSDGTDATDGGTDASDGTTTTGDDGGTDTSDGTRTSGDDGGTDTSDGTMTAGDDGGTDTSDGTMTTGDDGGTDASGGMATTGSDGGTTGSDGGTTGGEGGTAGGDGSTTGG